MRRWAAPFVVALLCARALIPAGVMLAPIDGELSVVLCDSDAASAARDEGRRHHTDHHHSQADPTCPYAQSAGPAPLPSFPALPPAALASLPIPTAYAAQIHAISGPTRQQSPRGPPALT
jgi:hypothetical protein